MPMGSTSPSWVFESSTRFIGIATAGAVVSILRLVMIATLCVFESLIPSCCPGLCLPPSRSRRLFCWSTPLGRCLRLGGERSAQQPALHWERPASVCTRRKKTCRLGRVGRSCRKQGTVIPELSSCPAATQASFALVLEDADVSPCDVERA